jgi:hypothetical protein
LTGISEILVLVLLITCILILPRMFKAAPAELKVSPKLIKKLSLKNRLAVVLTLVYPLAMALYLKPWNENLISYISYAIVPVLLFWATIWILAARRK